MGQDQHLFNIAGDWVGWLPFDNHTVITPSGAYLGTITHSNDRLLRQRSAPRFPRPLRPLRRLRITTPTGMTDIDGMQQ